MPAQIIKTFVSFPFVFRRNMFDILLMTTQAVHPEKCHAAGNYENLSHFSKWEFPIIRLSSPV